MLCLSACGENFLVGGASIGGTGKPTTQPPNVHPSDQYEQHHRYIWLAAPVVKECSSLTFKLQFIHPLTQQPILENSIFNLNQTQDQNGNNLHLQLSITNTSPDVVVEQQPSCYVPINLYTSNVERKIHPEQSCATTQEFIYAPNETKLFEVIHRVSFAYDQDIQRFEWRFGEESVFFKKDQSQLSCPILSLPFEIKKTRDSSHVITVIQDD